MDIELVSPAFDDNKIIPDRYTCYGGNVSPPLIWSELPERTKSLALICEDVDSIGGPDIHWIIVNLPVALRGLRENIPPAQILENGAIQGVNYLGHVGYTGPCHKVGSHRYFFTLYALDAELALDSEGVSKPHVMNAMRGHILAQGCTLGKYKK